MTILHPNSFLCNGKPDISALATCIRWQSSQHTVTLTIPGRTRNPTCIYTRSTLTYLLFWTQKVACAFLFQVFHFSNWIHATLAFVSWNFPVPEGQRKGVDRIQGCTFWTLAYFLKTRSEKLQKIVWSLHHLSGLGGDPQGCVGGTLCSFGPWTDHTSLARLQWHADFLPYVTAGESSSVRSTDTGEDRVIREQAVRLLYNGTLWNGDYLLLN